MIRLGLRLAFAGGRESRVRMVVMALGIGIGVALLLFVLAADNGMKGQNQRAAWLYTSAHNAKSSVDEKTTDPLWWSTNVSEFHGKLLGRIDVAATGSRSPIPPGITSLPGAGDFYASPALHRLLVATPTNELSQRFGGQEVGVIQGSALPDPNILLAIAGHEASELAGAPWAAQVRSIETRPAVSGHGSDGGPIGYNSGRLDVVLAIAIVGMLIPTMVLISSATRLSAARREQRFAAMRLVGTTPMQISIVGAIEAAVAAALGVAIGSAAFMALRHWVATTSFLGSSFHVEDFRVGITELLMMVVLVPMAGALVSALAMRRVRISPLGVLNRTTPGRPRLWRVIPLVAGVAELGYFAWHGAPDTTQQQVNAYLAGFAMTMVGIVSAGPLFVAAIGRGLIVLSRSASGLIAGRRLVDAPAASFRAVSGVVLALFVTTVGIGAITTVLAIHSSDVSERTLLMSMRTGEGAGSTQEVSNALLERLRSTPGVVGVATVRSVPQNDSSSGRTSTPTGVALCSELANTPDVGKCAPGAAVASLDIDPGGGVVQSGTQEDQIWTASSVTVEQVDALAPRWLVVATDGSAASVERAKTALESSFPFISSPFLINGLPPSGAELYRQWQKLAGIMTAASLVIGGCSMAVAMAGGIVERKRPFSLLRLTGMPVTSLRRVVMAEGACPLLIGALLSVGLGMLTVELFLRAQLSQSLHSLPGTYWVLCGIGVVGAMTTLASTLPVLERLSGPESARSE